MFNTTVHKKKTNKIPAALLAGVLALIILGFLPTWLGADSWGELVDPPAVRESAFSVHVIDIGQGDSILVLAQGEAMLIDGGERGQEETVIRYLREQGVTELRYVIATHPHADHIGGLAYGVLEAFTIREVIAPRLPQEMMPTSQSYEKFLTVLTKLRTEEGTKATPAEPGAVFALGEAEFTILGPLAVSENMNDNSVVIRLDYGACSVLLTGDAEKDAETRMIEHWGTALQADLLKVGHHGSKTSSRKKFLEAVSPEHAAISSGFDNSYKHPHADTLERLNERGVAIHRTDLDGTLVFFSDGVTLWRE